MTNFQIGDKVIITGVEGGTDSHGIIGSTCFVTSKPQLLYHRPTEAIAAVYQVDLPSPVPQQPGDIIAFRGEHLRLYYDGDSQERSTWDEELFQPRELVRVVAPEKMQ